MPEIVPPEPTPHTKTSISPFICDHSSGAVSP